MAELNFGLLTPPGSQSIGNAFVSGMDQAAVARAQENQNALSQYTLSKAKREDELTNQLLGDLRNATTNDEIYRAYQRAGKGEVASKLRGDALTQDKLRGDIALQPITLAGEKVKLAEGKLKQSRSMLEGINPADSGAAQQYIAWHEANHADPVLGPLLAARGVTMDQSRARIDKALQQPGGLAQLINESKVGTEEFTKQLLTQSKSPDVARLIAYRDSLPPGADRNAVTAQIENPLSQNFVLNPNTGKFEDRRQGQQPPSNGAAPAPRGFVDPGIAQGVTPLLQAPNADEALRQALAMDAAGLPVNIRGRNALPGAQPPAAAPVNMMGAQPPSPAPAPAPAATTPLNPKEKLEDFQTTLKLEEAGYRRTPQGNLEFIPGGKADPTVQARQSTEKLSAKDLQKRETVYPQATAAIKGFETKSDTFIKDLEKLRDHPGLSSITGIAAGRLPGLTSDGRAAQALYDKVVAKGGFQALQDLRDASKTGGALGNVSNQEGKQLTASFAAIDRRQDALDVQAAINQAIADIQGARTRTREAYDSTYSYKNPAPAGGGVVDFGSLR